jgi:dolichol-phosphate mannosyltransferase
MTSTVRTGTQPLRTHVRQFIKFAIVGGSGVLVNLAVFNLTLLVWHPAHGVGHHTAEYLANALGFVVSVVTNYYLNRRWTFRSTDRVATQFPKFLTVSLAAYGLNLIIFTLCLHKLGLGPNPSQLVAIVIVMPFNFIVNKLWSFK